MSSRTIRICAAARDTHERANCSKAAPHSSKCKRSSTLKAPLPTGPSLGTLKADILASEDGVVTGIDCLRLNRLARMAGAPIDKGAGIRVLKKIGDRVEKGEPIYRIHAFEPSEYELAVGAAKMDAGYQIGGNPPAGDGPQQ